MAITFFLPISFISFDSFLKDDFLMSISVPAGRAASMWWA